MSRSVIIIILIGFIILITTSYFLLEKTPAYKPENQNANEENIRINGIDLLVDIADEPNEQAQGLSGKDKMAENKGMLFIFPQPLVASFWMKDMRFALDMLWIDANSIIVGITKNISPDTFPKTFQPPSPIKYVLEVNSGWSDRNKIKIRDLVSF